ncbi:GNAT family N-acetyltransferase [Carnobacterium mobile]|uniref:GNAT family N-acetyltransferase n=1 Tax=Carnobacterium mobile TaxID=2750 RepID=UPI00068AF192|nr:GNAT family N-acetyltransferase [Carnobacterium mobile]
MIQLKKVTTQKEAQTVAQLAKEIWEEHYTAILGEQQVAYMLANLQSETAIFNELTQGKEYFLVQSNHTIVGYISYQLLPDQLFLSKLYLKQTERGQGTGRLLIEQLKDIAAKNKKEQLVLTVNKYNTNTIAAYKKFGFELVKEQVADIGGGYVMDDYVLQYRLIKKSGTSRPDSKEI